MPKFEVTALSENGMAGEGPLFFIADDSSGAVSRYLEWATETGGTPFPRISAQIVA